MAGVVDVTKLNALCRFAAITACANGACTSFLSWHHTPRPKCATCVFSDVGRLVPGRIRAGEI